MALISNDDGFMLVERVERSNGVRGIEPALNSRWSELDKLRWHAGVVRADSGLRVGVEPYGRDLFDVYCEYGSGMSNAGHFSFKTAWEYLSGLGTGALAMLHRPVD